MTEELRKDLLAIVLEEAFGMREQYARKLVNGVKSVEGRFVAADNDAMDAAAQVIDRFQARCSRIEG